MQSSQHIDTEACEGCGICVQICPMHIFILHGFGRDARATVLAERSACCMGCGHCMAVCPTRSVNVDGLSYERDFFEPAKIVLEGETFVDFLAIRRSVRVFKDRPVPRDLLEKIVQAVTLAPMGFTPHKTQITIVSNREMIEGALPLILEVYSTLQKRWKNPLFRNLIRRSVPPEVYSSMEEHLMPSLQFRLPEMRMGGVDTITRGAPALLLFHAKQASGNHTEDALIALTYALLTAHALGLGATAIGLLPPAIEHSPQLKSYFQIPSQNEVVTTMIVGYPKIPFRRAIRRELAGVNWL